MADSQALPPMEATRQDRVTPGVVHQSGPIALALRYAAIAVFCAVALLPVYAAVVTSLTEYPNIGRGDLFPSDWAWHNYIDVWSQIPLAQYMFATLIYALTSALGSVVLARWPPMRCRD